MDEKAPDQDEGEAILEAEQIYVLMKKDFRLSRNTPVSWMWFPWVPKDPDSDWDWDIGHLYSYRVNSGSMVHFLAQRYRLVYLLDLSPSSFGSAVFPAFKKCLQALVRPFYVPGSQLLLKPDIYVTVIAWTPFLTDYSQQVLKQGFLLTSENLGSYLSSILDKLKKLGVRVSGIAASALQNIQSGRAESERIMGHLFEDEEPVEPCASIPVATPEAGFINMIRTGILALQLLPKLSSGGIIVVTDGIFSIPDMNICDSLLNQLRSSTISLSFLQVASAYHPHAGYGRVPYVELMEFFSCATYGTYLPKVPEVHHESYVFRKALEGLKLLTPPQVIEDRNIKRKGVLHQGVKNSLFKHSDEEFIIKKTLLEATMQCRLSSLLSVRLREGYTLNTVHILTDMIQVQLTLPWKIGTYIHYTVQCPWPQAPGPQLPLATVVVYVEGFYDTLHDIICRKDTIYSSHDRNNVTRRFYVTLQNLAHNIKKSVPLFYMPPNSTTPVFYREEFANTAFGSFWKPINFLDINIWHRWMHTNRIHIMLQHDHPLPRHLFLANSSGRYTSVHCRKAALKLFEMLKEISTFVLLENNSYVQFIKNEEDSSSNLTSHPSSFYVIRITSKPPCVVIWLAFPSGASANVRHRVHHQLLLKIDELRIRQNHLDLITPIEVKGTTLLLKPVERILVRYNKIPSDFFNLLEPAYSSGNLHHQPLLKCDGNNSTTNNNNNGKNSHPMLQQSRATSSHGTFLALARYLHHKRWIWCIRSSNFVNRNLDGEGKFLDTLISGQVLARILHTLAKSRLLEGFTFAHSHLGVQNLALELPMRHETKNVFAKKSLFTQQCVVQYVIFPPHTEFYSNVSSKNQNDSITTRNDESSSEKEDEGTSGEIQIITEVWVEPQDGVVEDGREERQYLNELKYRELPDAFFKRDKEIITTLLSFEHLVSSFEYLNYEEKEGELDNKKFMSSSTSNRDPFSTVSYIPYSPDIIQLLGKSSSVEILLSMFIQDLSDSESQHLNEKLYNKILSHIEENHDQEYPLSENEDIDFLQLILSTDSYRRKVKDSWIREDSYAKWRCFVKVFHNNHIIITLLPETYEELMNLMLIDDDDDEEEEEMTNKTPRDPNGHDKEFLDMEEEFEKKIMG
ncbi:SZT2 [Lepeophtheirus salmonis]|uniref:SZT2 n=1 Tax=Lepeophtheirus salmonis TaxID=72036 RepID=A0A7R8CP13_LEPSM|nr:SZT2 [Lepeophtheirus salmonis]CAF2846149.1 SZT2 [Lepeophtheirus salmonis]